MPIFNRTKKAAQPLNESSKQVQIDVSSLLNLPYYASIQRLQSSSGSNLYGITSEVKKSMLKDPIISRVINMWISDTLSKDVLTKDIYSVDIELLDSAKESKEIEKELATIQESVEYLRTNSNLDELLPQILYNVIVYGNATIRLGFIDGYEDTKIKLFESNKKKLLKETESWTAEDTTKLLEAPNFDEYLLDDTTKKKNTKITRLSGRYYIELLPKRIVPLKHKGITILYMDLDNTTKVLNPKNITSFINTRGSIKTISIKQESDDIVSDLYEMHLGESFIDNAVTPWSMLNSVEDCTMLALMTRSAIYRLFQVDVGSLSTEETEKFVQEFKARLNTRESIDIRQQYYSSAHTQLPLGDSIVVPTRNGIGTISLQTIGNDLKLDTDAPLKFFRQELLAALGVPEGLIYGDTGNGGLINTSATKQDIRYLRTIQQFTYILSEGLKNLFKDYLKMLGVDISKLGITVNFAQINNEQDIERIEYEQTKQEALVRVIDSLSALGINFDNMAYTETRNLLIKRYLDSELLESITQDEKAGDVSKDTGDKEKSKERHSSFGGISRPKENPGPEADFDSLEEEPTENNSPEKDEILPLDSPEEETTGANLENLPPYS